MTDFDIKAAYEKYGLFPSAIEWMKIGLDIDQAAADADEAEYCYRSAISLDPFNSKCHAALISLLVDTLSYSNAIKAWDVAVDLLRDPNGKDDNQLYSNLHYPVILNLLHKVELIWARKILLGVPPDILKEDSYIGLAARAYAELLLIEQETAAGLYVDRELLATRRLPAPKLNPNRYIKH